MENYGKIYEQELLNNVIPFWLDHSRDEEFGGYFSCLDRFGKVYDTDKFIWMQGREVWLFSMLYNKVDRRQEWLDMAIHGAEFLKNNGRDKNGNWYFSLTREGKPLVQPYNIFSDCFAAMGFGTLYNISNKDEYGNIARATFKNILHRRENPKGIYNKTISGTRDLKNFALPMILSNLSLELEHILEKDLVNNLLAEVVHEVMEVFYIKDRGLIVENIGLDNRLSDSFEGRLFNPGHGLEAMWFIMDIGTRLNDRSLIEKAKDIALQLLEHGWDKDFGGIFYQMDIDGHPPLQLEWDQKLWWVHLEALVCLMKAYKLTGDQRAKVWFEKVHEYTWNHFRDSEYPEWYGYLNRKGEVLIPLKGGKWKGCFHVPRGLYQIWNTSQGN